MGDEYFIVYWKEDDSHSETISFNDLGQANAEYDRLLNGGKILDVFRKEEFEPVGLKLVQTLRGFGTGDLTKRALEMLSKPENENNREENAENKN